MTGIAVRSEFPKGGRSRGRRGVAPGPIRVLLVDDDPIALGRLYEAVSSSGIGVVGTTNDGEHALELAGVLHPDMALIDWDMGHFGGALTAWLMARYAPEVTAVLLLEDADVEEAEAAGSELAFWTIPKGAAPLKLRQQLRAIHRQRGRREVFAPAAPVRSSS